MLKATPPRYNGGLAVGSVLFKVPAAISATNGLSKQRDVMTNSLPAWLLQKVASNFCWLCCYEQMSMVIMVILMHRLDKRLDFKDKW